VISLDAAQPGTFINAHLKDAQRAFGFAGEFRRGGVTLAESPAAEIFVIGAQ
jgi:hypothetical protein